MVFESQQAILGRFVRLKTSDVGELSHALSWARSHRLDRAPGRAAGRSVVSYAPLEHSSLGYRTSTEGFSDRIGPTESAFCLLLVVDGGGEHSIGSRRFPLTRAAAAMHSAGQGVDVTTGCRSGMLSISLRKTAIVTELQNQLGRAIQAPVEFAPSLNMATGAGFRLRYLAERLCQSLDSSPGKHLLAVAQFERWLISHVVNSQRHNYTRLLNRVSSAAPWQVHAAEEFIRANAAKSLSLGDIASVSGVSVRTLQYSFQRHRGMGPMHFLRQVRLEHVHGELLSVERTTTVSEAAMRWGFSHFGRFASDYTKRYGEAPSATLRRNRAARRPAT